MIDVGVEPKWAAECPPERPPPVLACSSQGQAWRAAFWGFLPYACSAPLVGRTDPRGDQHDAADDVAKCRVVIDAADAPCVIGALPAHPPFPDPSRQCLAPVERTDDDGLAGARWWRIAREMTDDCTPGEKLHIARDAHLHAELPGGGGKRASLLFARRDLGAQHIGRRLSAMDKQHRHDDRTLAAPR